MSNLRIALYYEHPQWFKPLVAELEWRGVAVIHQRADAHAFDPLATANDIDLVVNRMSPSANTRGNGNTLFYTNAYLHHVESLGIPVVNGSATWQLEISKAQQLVLMERLGIRYPKARVINHPATALAASDGLQFPVVVKANIGGSGAGITLFETREELAAAVDAGLIDLGLDSTALVQEFLTPADGYIVRVEFLDGEFLYAIKVESNPADGFNLCPADVCEVPAEGSATNGNHVGDNGAVAPVKRDVQSYTPSQTIIDQVLRIADVGGLEIGGVEYLVSDRDGESHFYDINALSNFVANAPEIVGFDPFVNFADYLVKRAAAGRQQRAGVGVVLA